MGRSNDYCGSETLEILPMYLIIFSELLNVGYCTRSGRLTCCIGITGGNRILGDAAP